MNMIKSKSGLILNSKDDVVTEVGSVNNNNNNNNKHIKQAK